MAEIFWDVEGQRKLASGNCGNTSRNNQMVMAFDATTAESVRFGAVLPSDYSAETITVTIYWAADTATSGDVVWSVAFERGNTDMDADSFNTARTGTTTTNATAGIGNTTAITFTQAQADGVTASDKFRIQLQRVAADAGDTMTGDAHVDYITLAY